MTGTRHERPSLQHLGFVADVGSQGFHGHLGPVLVEKPQADAEGDDHHDDDGVGAAAGQRRYQGGGEQHDQDGVADLTEQHRAGPHPMGGECVRSELA